MLCVSEESAWLSSPRCSLHFLVFGLCPPLVTQVDDGLRFDAAAKAELHARLLSTASALWDVVDAREAAASREVHALEADGWVAHTQQSCAKHFALIMQLEVRWACRGLGPLVRSRLPPFRPPPILPPPC